MSLQGRLELTPRRVSCLPSTSLRLFIDSPWAHPGNLLLLGLGPKPAGPRPACNWSLADKEEGGAQGEITARWRG